MKPRGRGLLGGLILAAGGFALGTLSSTADAAPIFSFAPLRDDESGKCAQELGKISQVLGFPTLLWKGAPLPMRGSWKVFRRSVGRSAQRMEADLIIHGTLRSDRMVLEAYAALPVRLVGLREIRTARKCMLTEKGEAALRRWLENVAKRRQGVLLFEPKARSEVEPSEVPVITPSFGAERGATSTTASPRKARPTKRQRSRRRSATPKNPRPEASASQRADAPEAAPSSPDRAWLRVFIGLGTRELDFSGVQSPGLLGMRSGGSFLPGLAIGAWPFRGWLRPLEDLEIRASHRQAVGFRASTAEGEGADVIQAESLVELAYPLPVRGIEAFPLTLAPRLGLHHVAVRLDGDANDSPREDLPGVENLSLELGGEIASILFERIAVTLGGAYLAVLDSGALTQSGTFENGQVSGLLVDGRIEILFENWQFGVEGGFLGYGVGDGTTQPNARGDDRMFRFGATITTRL